MENTQQVMAEIQKEKHLYYNGIPGGIYGVFDLNCGEKPIEEKLDWGLANKLSKAISLENFGETTFVQWKEDGKFKKQFYLNGEKIYLDELGNFTNTSPAEKPQCEGRKCDCCDKPNSGLWPEVCQRCGATMWVCDNCKRSKNMAVVKCYDCFIELDEDR